MNDEEFLRINALNDFNTTLIYKSPIFTNKALDCKISIEDLFKVKYPMPISKNEYNDAC